MAKFFPGMILMGAQSRLLPPSIPFRFFVAALVFHLVAWGAVAMDAEQVSQFAGGPGWLLAAIHALTLGVLVMTAIGASFQILPVVTGQSLAALWPCKLVFWTYVPGTAAVVAGFAVSDTGWMTVGAILVVLGLSVFAVLIADVLRRTRGMPILALHGWATLAALAALAVFGVLLVFNLDYGFLADHGATALAHVVLAVYGFMGLLVFGYSQFMVPMFALGPSPEDRHAYGALALGVLAIAGAVIAALAGSTAGLVASAAGGLAAAVVHIRSMSGILRAGMRKQLGLSFVLVHAAWAFLCLGLVVGAAAAADWDERTVSLFGLVVIVGWLLTFLMGVLQRIIPFLAAMNAAKSGQTPPTPSEVAVETPLKVHAACHFLALALLAAGIVADSGTPVLVGSLAGAVGAVAFLVFAIGTLRRMASYGEAAPAAVPPKTPNAD